MRAADVLRAAWVVVASGAAYSWVLLRRLVLRQRHELDWPVDLEMVAAGFRVSLRLGNLATMRLLLGALSRRPLWLHPGLRVTRIHPPGCAPAFWLDLSSSAATAQPPDVVLAYTHGGAFVAGDALMCAATFKRWMRSLAACRLHARVLCLSYPLAPEQPFPAAVASTAAAFAWLGQELAGSSATFIALGDSAGGNITVAALAALRGVHSAGEQQQQSQLAAPQGHSGSTPAGSSASSKDTTAPAGDAQAAATPTVTAAVEARLFADLRARLALQGSSSSSATSSSGSSVGPRMPSAVVLVSPATDISPSACFRAASDTPHHDYLPRNLEARAMGSYSERHEALCGQYASPVHLGSLAGLTTSGGRWLVLSGGVEILAADIRSFVRKLRQQLGPGMVVHHEEPRLPHSWAVLPLPSLTRCQEVVPAFIAAERAAAVARSRGQ